MHGRPSRGWFLSSHLVSGTAAILCGILFISAIHRAPEKPVVKNGDQVLLDHYLGGLKGKRVGLVMNPTARINGVHMLDTLLARGVNVTALFGPEHGFRGQRGSRGANCQWRGQRHRTAGLLALRKSEETHRKDAQECGRFAF